MKKIIVLLLAIAPVFFFSCKDEEAEKKLQAQIDSMKQISGEDTKTIEEYMKAINEIRENLNTIKEKEKIISSSTDGNVELDATEKDKINEDINTIYDLMLENKKKLAYLQNKLKNSDSKNSEFKKTIEGLTAEMSSKNEQIAELKTKLEEMHMDMAELNEKVASMSENITELEEVKSEKEKEISEQDKKLHTAYYIIDKKEALLSKGIVSVEGKVLGMGGVQKIHPKTEEFKEIDIRESKQFSLNSVKKAKILSQHPDGSYTIKNSADGKFESISINDEETFWSMSKYLVIITD